ncbi:hypothetical protein BO83DRAFT_417894 [Aspergillus eucalypticola CBS 122712]|uniref:Geminivirus AL1 replication-associated protein catalytic domain-containing protein n=1 Tax=Aspergillus eucalypticola (strain CBS 122712 / IBT 29274) TaxID=1448314 RepID=A0A317VE37_ASPEC|nr:uncharacterized protein BO83DRAFT_417894 [Aspergillus eucalypticola CBS 122712]PWY71297.1 hypothetical protein BO83DRAFT_417894 [Aspergillus eucalypticola CBS 122712]
MTFGRFHLESTSDLSQSHSVVPARPSSHTSGPSDKKKHSQKIHCRWIFLTYTDSSFEQEDDFVNGFRAMLERNSLASSTFFGCREDHTEGGVLYHVLLHLGKQVNWKVSTAHRYLVVSDNPHESINIITRYPEVKYPDFIHSHVEYCEQVALDDCFGICPNISAAQVARYTRKWVEVGQQPTKAAKRVKLIELLPHEYDRDFDSIESALDYEHRRED